MELFESLRKEDQTEAIERKLRDYYQYEINNLMYYAMSAKKPSIYMGLFVKQGSQYIADLSVSDLYLEKQETYNWHLQNTSQWKYVGCILVQDGEVSTHH